MDFEKNPLIARVLAALLLLVFFAQGVYASKNAGITNDEFVHIPAGFSYVEKRDFRLNTEQPTLTKWLAGIAVNVAGAEYPEGSLGWEGKDQVQFAEDFWQVNQESSRKLLFAARIPGLILCTLLGAFIFFFAQLIYNTKAGLLALFIFAFEPNLIAHSSLANSDALLALCVVATLYFAYRFLLRLDTSSFICMLALAGIALITNYSALILLPLILFLYNYFLRNYPTQFKIPERVLGMNLTLKRAWARNYALVGAVAFWLLVTGIIAVLSSYLFHLTVISPENSPNFIDLAESTLPDWLPGKQALIDLAQKMPLPKEYVMGVYQAYFHNQIGHPAFLLGQHELLGRWYYYPVVFFFKAPIALILLALLSFILSFRKDREVWISEAVLVIPIIIYSALAMLSHINAGVRDILVIIPLLIIYASGVMAVDFKRKRFDPAEYKVGGKPRKKQIVSFRPALLYAAITFLAVFHVYSVHTQAPYFLSYMNEFSDGEERQAYLLGDSNLDWGQGLPALDRWARENEIERLHLFYERNDDPSLYEFGYIWEDPGTLDPELFMPGEVYAVSLWMLTGMDEIKNSASYEEERERARERYDRFRGISPDAVVGGSFWIFAP